jgi:hypothetical protein
LSGSPNFQLSSYEICHSSLIVLQKQKTQKLTKTLENNKAKGLTSAIQGVQIHNIWHSSINTKYSSIRSKVKTRAISYEIEDLKPWKQRRKNPRNRNPANPNAIEMSEWISKAFVAVHWLIIPCKINNIYILEIERGLGQNHTTQFKQNACVASIECRFSFLERSKIRYSLRGGCDWFSQTNHFNLFMFKRS